MKKDIMVTATRFTLEVLSPEFGSPQEVEEATDLLKTKMLQMGFKPAKTSHIASHERLHALNDEQVTSGKETGQIEVRALGLKIRHHFYPVIANAEYKFTGRRTPEEEVRIASAVPDPSDSDLGIILRNSGITLRNIITGKS